jgi:hypothetical protein
MAREIPEVVRAAAGLAATVVDEARKLPETLPGLPVRIVGMAMQHAMKVQQQYAGLVARGDELFTGIRGEAEPGLATFDDDGDAAPAQGFRSSAFDRADVVPDEVPDRVGAQTTVEAFVQEAPATEEILDELAVDEAIEAAPTLEETAPAASAAAGALDADVLESDAATDQELVEELGVAGAAIDDVPVEVDVLTADGGDVATVEATVTDEGIAAVVPEAGTDDGTDVARGDGPIATATGVLEADAAGAAPDDAPIAAGAAVDAPADGTQGAASSAPAEAPIDGYDSFSIAQLRGRLRGYALSTVADLVAYEEANQAREPYLRMLRNRLEKLEEQAVESSPLAPRGA